ncbi:MAG TPA: peptidylprolyl isomerase [Polyangiaceae bacterium]|nr:peptidylprolyl isomerase [Polyangiaceae bacterium]
MKSLPFARPAAPLILLLLNGCTDLTAPAPYKPDPAAAPQPAAAKPTTVKPAAAAVAPDDSKKPDSNKPSAEGDSAGETIEASHVLVAYQGAMRSQATRSKEDAQKLAEQVVSQAKAGKDFAALAKEFSDDKGSAAKGGSLGRFPARRMVKQFADAVSALKPGEISGVVESPFGFHVILRSP